MTRVQQSEAEPSRPGSNRAHPILPYAVLYSCVGYVHPVFQFCFVIVTFCLYFVSLYFIPSSLPSFWSLVSSFVRQLDVGLLVLFFGPLSLPSFLYCLPPGLSVSSFCWSINWTYHRIDRTSNKQPCPLGTRPAP